jgi:DNA mismatch repair ATPase MutS
VKAFLMYRDRDFDPQQIVSQLERDHRSRTAELEARYRELLPWNEAALRQDLGLDILCDAMAGDDRFLLQVARLAILSSLTDLDAVLYRQEVLRDCLKNEAVIREMYQLAVEAIARERKGYWSYFARYPAGILSRSVEVLQMFVVMLRRLRTIADEHATAFQSQGFLRLFRTLQDELDDTYFARIDEHLRRLKFRDGVLVSAQLGQGNKGINYVLRKPNKDERGLIERWLGKPEGYTFKLHPRDESGARALSELRDRGVNLVANALAQSTDHILSFFNMLRTELAFYIGCLNLHNRLTGMGEPICFPTPAQRKERLCAFRGLYDASLALSAGRMIVANDFQGDGKSLAIITGPNTGGKSTFLRSVGLAHMMMQAGMFAPAEAFHAGLCDRIFTHYKREEDAAMTSGKWDEELSRMSEIVDHVTPHSLVLFNESFASTNEREGSQIASEIVRALLERNVRVFFVTHMYELARGFSAQKMPDAIFLRAERLADGARTFRVKEGEPLQTSYGEDLYQSIFGQRPLPRAARAEAV